MSPLGKERVRDENTQEAPHKVQLAEFKSGINPSQNDVAEGGVKGFRQAHFRKSLANQCLAEQTSPGR